MNTTSNITSKKPQNDIFSKRGLCIIMVACLLIIAGFFHGISAPIGFQDGLGPGDVAGDVIVLQLAGVEVKVDELLQQ